MTNLEGNFEQSPDSLSLERLKGIVEVMRAYVGQHQEALTFSYFGGLARGESREVYDIGAVLVRRSESGEFVVVDKFRRLVKLELTDKLPEYSTKLTGITQAEIDKDGIPFAQMVAEFKEFAGERPAYAWGHDGEILIENCQLKNIPSPFSLEQFHNLREMFKEYGVPADNYHSSTIVTYFGEQNKHTAHQGLDDALNQVEALNLLRAQLEREGGTKLS